MFGKIKYITEGEAHVESKIEPGQDVDLMNSNVVFEAPNQAILGEVEEVNDDTIKMQNKSYMFECRKWTGKEQKNAK